MAFNKFLAAWLPFLNLTTTPGITTVSLGNVDDGNSNSIFILTGFPFGNTVHSTAFVSKTNMLNMDVYNSLILFS